MTLLKKPVHRRSSTIIRDGSKRRELVVSLYPQDVIGLRPLGTRRQEFVSIDAVYSLAVKQRVARERAEKKAARRAQ